MYIYIYEVNLGFKSMYLREKPVKVHVHVHVHVHVNRTHLHVCTCTCNNRFTKYIINC